MDVLTLLKQDHKTVSGMIDTVQKSEPGDARLVELGEQIAKALTVHAAIEEEFFYPELRDRAEGEEGRVDVFEAFTEHDVVKHLIALLKSGRKNDELFKAELQVLGESVKHHVKEEESTIFSLARELMDQEELDELGEAMEAAKQRLMSRSTARGRKTGTRKGGTKKSSAKKSSAKKAATHKSGAKKSPGRKKGTRRGR